MKRTVYHGTHRAYAAAVAELGLPAVTAQDAARTELRPTLGVRVRLRRTEAWRDARAWVAYLLVRNRSMPEGVIFCATIEDSRIQRPRGEVLRVTRLEPQEIRPVSIKFPEFDAVVLDRRPVSDLRATHNALDRALDDFEKLTRPTPRRRSR